MTPIGDLNNLLQTSTWEGDYLVRLSDNKRPGKVIVACCFERNEKRNSIVFIPCTGYAGAVGVRMFNYLIDK